MKYARALPFWILVAVLVIFSLSNRDIVTVTFFPFAYESELPLYLVFFGGLFLGFVMAGLIMLWRSAASGVERHRSARNKADLEGKLAAYEEETGAQPLAGAAPAGGQSPKDASGQSPLANKTSNT
jgi:uncharacterized integral membrane protein